MLLQHESIYLWIVLHHLRVPLQYFYSFYLISLLHESMLIWIKYPILGPVTTWIKILLPPLGVPLQHEFIFIWFAQPNPIVSRVLLQPISIFVWITYPIFRSCDKKNSSYYIFLRRFAYFHTRAPSWILS